MTDPKPAMTVGAYSMQQIAKRFGVSVATVRGWIASGKLPAYHLPGNKRDNIVRVDSAEVDRFRLKYKVTA